MKRILLTSTALVAFAGAAAAEVSWSGATTLSYNDEINDGMDFDVDLDVTLSQELDNGLTAAVTFGFELTDGEGPTADADGFVADNNATLSLSSDTATLTFGDTAFAAEGTWSGVTNMNEDGFSEADGETVIKGEMTFGSVSTAVSYAINNTDIGAEVVNTNAGDGDLEQLSIGVTADLGSVTVGLAYQQEVSDADTAADFVAFNSDFTAEDVMGLSVSGTVGAADLTFAYADSDGESSTGIQVSYPVGDLTVGAFFVAESAIDDSYGLSVDYASGAFAVGAFFHDGGDEDSGLTMSYDMGNGIVVYAGSSDDDGSYLAAEYDLGGGASALFSYGDDAGNDEIGPQEYNDGTTIAVSFSF